MVFDNSIFRVVGFDQITDSWCFISLIHVVLFTTGALCQDVLIDELTFSLLPFPIQTSRLYSNTEYFDSQLKVRLIGIRGCLYLLENSR